MVNLLIITQKIDRNDDILGFFHSWVEKFSQKCGQVTVVCLEKGEYALPENVRILSLGKEKGGSKIKYIFNFYRYIWAEKKKYDAVFVHMNPEYVVLGGWLWKILGKKIFLWYVHRSVTWKLKFAEKIVDAIFTASKKSVNLDSEKVKVMGHGIDTDFFRMIPGVEKAPFSLLYLGRISKIKNIACLVKAAKILDRKYVDFRLSVVGSPVLKEDFNYEKELKKIGATLVEKGKLEFFPKIKNSKAPDVYNHHEVFVNLSPLGLLDKVVLEAMATETLVLVSNRQFESAVSDKFIFKENNHEDLAEKLIQALSLKKQEKNNYGKLFRNYVVVNHNLDNLTDKIIEYVGEFKK